MTGVDIVGALLRAYEPLLVIVPEARIKGGALPEAENLPALLLRTVSSVDRQPLKRGPLVRVTDRVSVTVRAASYRDQKAVIKLVRTCCAGWLGSMERAERISILTAGLGPDVGGPAASFEQTQDFRVSFDTQA
jgi:hypothetical protein